MKNIILFILCVLLSHDSLLLTKKDIGDCYNLILSNNNLKEKLFVVEKGNELIGFIGDYKISSPFIEEFHIRELSLNIDRPYKLMTGAKCLNSLFPIYFCTDSIHRVEKNRFILDFKITNDSYIEESKREIPYSYYVCNAYFSRKKNWELDSIDYREFFIAGNSCNNQLDYNYYNKLMVEKNKEEYDSILNYHDSLLNEGIILQPLLRDSIIADSIPDVRSLPQTKEKQMD